MTLCEANFEFLAQNMAVGPNVCLFTSMICRYGLFTSMMARVLNSIFYVFKSNLWGVDKVQECSVADPNFSNWLGPHFSHVYIYIYIERERERET